MFSKKHPPNQEPGEYTVLFLRRHWFVALKIILFFTGLSLIPLVVFWLIQANLIELNGSNRQNAFLYLGASVYYLFVWLFFFNALLDFYLDMWIVTNRRIISIEQNGLFSRVVSEQRLSRVQDVTSEIKGLFPTFLNYGEVYIQTAGEVTRFIFKQVPNAREVAKQIIVLAEKRKMTEKII